HDGPPDLRLSIGERMQRRYGAVRAATAAADMHPAGRWPFCREFSRASLGTPDAIPSPRKDPPAARTILPLILWLIATGAIPPYMRHQRYRSDPDEGGHGESWSTDWPACGQARWSWGPCGARHVRRHERARRRSERSERDAREEAGEHRESEPRSPEEEALA